MNSMVSIVEYDSGMFKTVSEAYLDWYIVAKKIKWSQERVFYIIKEEVYEAMMI